MKCFRFPILFILLSFVFFLAARPVVSGVIRHVTPDGSSTGDCSDNSWSNPCSLQYALSIAQPGEEIWVKGGTYRPTVDGNKEVSFALKSGVAVYGGFAGNEDSRAGRRWGVNVTTLSGDLLGNDSGAARWDNPTFADNSYHVVTADGLNNTAILDGFTISGGNAEGGLFGDDPLSGGGISLVRSSPILCNLIIAGNTANIGANGGGLLIGDQSSSPWLTNVLFTGNQAGQQGGAIYNHMGAPVLTNVTFTGNKAVVTGGAIFTFMGSMEIRNSILWGNSAPDNPSLMAVITTLTLTHSDVQGGCPGGVPTGGCDNTNLYIDPNFINASGLDGIYGTMDDNPRLQKTSPLINIGSNIVTDPSLLEMDLDGYPRIVQNTVDMGAYEHQLNLPPSSSNQTFFTLRNKPLTGQLQASDPDGDLLTFQLLGNAPPGNLDLHENGSFVYTPVPDAIAPVSFQFEVWDHIAAPVGPYIVTIKGLYPCFLPSIHR